MFEKCSNPDCGLPFDYRKGRLIRFCSTDAMSPAGPHCVEHFWLCGKCSERYVFAHERGVGMKIRLRVAEFRKTACSWSQLHSRRSGANRMLPARNVLQGIEHINDLLSDQHLAGVVNILRAVE
jgi:hypothetical protein